MSSDKPKVNSRRATPSPPVAGADSLATAAAKQRRGTDPARYKTTICRNWESTGSCTFKGCTFAHGNDELRPLSTKSPSPTVTPAAHASTSPLLAAPLVPPSSSNAAQHPPLPRSLAVKTTSTEPTSTGSSLQRTPNSAPVTAPMSFTVTSPAVQSSSLPSSNGGGSTHQPPPSYASAVAHAQMMGQHQVSTGSSPPPQAVTFSLGATLSAPEHIAEAILSEIAHCRDMAAVNADANASLERALYNEQRQRVEMAERLKALKSEASQLRVELEKRRASRLARGLSVPPVPPLAAQPPLNVAAASFVPTTLQLGGSIAPDATQPIPVSSKTYPSSSAPLLHMQHTNSSIGGSMTTGSDASEAVASPTEAANTDRLKKILESLHLEDE
jgi:hypothetical protein